MKNLFALLFCAAAAWAQVAGTANQNYKTHAGREAVARGLANPGRDAEQHPRELVEAMNLKPGMTVADVGTGVGYMLPYLSHAVGPGGRVLAEDIASDFLDKARLRAQTTNLHNVQFILGTSSDSKLPGGSVDAVLVLEVYHHFDYPAEMLKSIREALVSDGRLYIVDYYKRPNAMPGGNAMQHIRLDEDDVAKEVEAHGFKEVGRRVQSPGHQYMLIFEKRTPE